MRFSRVLLITVPVKDHRGLGQIRPNIGLAYIAQMLEENGIEHDVLDMLLGYGFRSLERRIRRFRPDLIGVSLFSNRFLDSYEMLGRIKKTFPGVAIVAGGPHVSSFREKTLRDCPAIDFGMFYEGEHAFVELCSGTSLDRIGNLIYRSADGIVSNSAREFVTDLDSLPFPRYTKFELGRYSSEKAIVTTRGCPYDCTYCTVKTVSGRQVRMRSPANVVGEMEYWYRKGYRQFCIQDDNFTYDRAHAAGICDEIRRRGLSDMFITCFGARADSLDRELLDLMRSVGFQTISIGAEAGNDRMLAIVKKSESIADIDRGVRMACEAGFQVYLFFLFQLPFQTRADIDDTIALALRYPIFYVEWFNVIPYPGTELHDWLAAGGYLFSDAEEYLNGRSAMLHGVHAISYPVFNPPGMSMEERRAIVPVLKGIRRMVLRRGFSRWFRARGVPAWIADAISWVISFNGVTKRLLRIKERRIIDRLRVSLRDRRRSDAVGTAA